MSVAHQDQRKSERIGLRASRWQRGVLQAASEAEGTSISEFVMRYATRAAEDILADRRVFVVDDETWERFDAAIDRDAKDVPGLEKLMNTPTVLDAH